MADQDRDRFKETPVLLLAAGLIFVIVWNYAKWRQDRECLRRRSMARPAEIRLDATPLVSILVAAWNAADILGEHIASIRALRYPNKELIVCAGGEDGTAAIAESAADERVIVLRQSAGEGKQHALQRCLERSSGSVIMLTDADTLLSDEAFERVIEPVVNGEEAATTGHSRPLARQLALPYVRYRWSVDAYAGRDRPAYVTGLLGRNAALRRDVLASCGAFRTPVATGTDYHLAKRLLAGGVRIRNIADSVVETRYVQSFGETMRAQSRWLRNVVLHGLPFRAYNEAVAGPIPSLLGLAMLGGLVAAPLMGGFVRGGCTMAWIHALLSRVRYLSFGESLAGESGKLSAYARLPAYAIVDFAAWALTLLQYGVGSLRSRW